MLITFFSRFELIACFVQHVIINTIARLIVYKKQLIFLMRCGLTFIQRIDKVDNNNILVHEFPEQLVLYGVRCTVYSVCNVHAL